ncbi:MAG: radical SAM protein [SAR324 cluster bacterium]|nr:radical SAM protein [SAR324 cluster bacterium]
MIDTHGRNINKLRVSIGEACNFSCIYCVDQIGAHQVEPHHLKFDGMLKLIELLKTHAGIEKVRLTGGEPLLFRPLPQLIQGIAELGISNIGVTSNGYLFPKLAAVLKEAGLKSVNVSLDSVDPKNFRRLARAGNLKRVLEGIESALLAGLKVKINTVVMRGENDHELNNILDYAFSREIEVRFLELMKMGPLFKKGNTAGTCSEKGNSPITPDQFVSMKEMLAEIGRRYSYNPIQAEHDSTALLFQTPQGNFGIIANESAPFCASCSRMRLTATGNLVGCLSNPQEISIRHLINASDPGKELQSLFTQSIAQKRDSTFTGSSLVMSSIGG